MAAQDLRRDFQIIADLIEPRSRVLDLGCGEGELLAWLKEHKRVEARGVERSSKRVQKAIAKGVSVYQGNLEDAVAEYPNEAFDYVVLSQTLQETNDPLRVLKGMLRIGRNAIVAFPNFGHYRVRLSVLFTGKAPKTGMFPHDWFNSPNIHFLTVLDFELLCQMEGWNVKKRLFLSGDNKITVSPNLFAETAVFLFSGKP